MQDNHQTQPEGDLEFALVRATTWDPIWTEIFLREDASEAGWHLAASKILEVLDDPCDDDDPLFETISKRVAHAQATAWAIMDQAPEPTEEAYQLIAMVVGDAVAAILRPLTLDDPGDAGL